MQENKCLKCNHVWLPRDPFREPKACPKCRSYDWNNKKKFEEKKINGNINKS